MLHITDGESVAGTLREAGVPGEVSIYGDLMYEGPAPAGLDPTAWRETRATFYEDAHYADLEEARAYLQSCDDALAASFQHEETVLWLDDRLSNQLILIRVLDQFSHQAFGRGKLWLIGDRPIGLEQLTADRLAALYENRLPVSAAQFLLGQVAWSAFTSPDPIAIQRLLKTDVSALPFLTSALHRHLEQFPSVDNGLSRSERQTLEVLRESGALKAQRIFGAVQAFEQPPFMGDSSFNRLLAELANAWQPLVQMVDPGEYAITETGLRVLNGREDHIELNGIDRWMGGVHLQATAAAWRWDRSSRRLIGT